MNSLLTCCLVQMSQLKCKLVRLIELVNTISQQIDWMLHAQDNIQFQQQQIIRQISSTREGVTVEISSPGLLILKYFTNKPHSSITNVYQIIKINHFKIAFKPKSALVVMHYDLVQKIQNFIETFCFSRISSIEHPQYTINMIRKKIKSPNQLIGIENNYRGSSNARNEMAIVFAKKHKQLIHQILLDSRNYEREDLIYPLNKYISNAIEAVDNQQFVRRLVQKYRDQLTSYISSQIQKTDQTAILNIQRIQPYFIPPDRSLSKQHRSGIYGILFEVSGKSNLFIRLYNVISIFLANLNYIVRPITEIYCWREGQIQIKFKKLGISAFLLNQTQVVIMKPPPNIDNIIISMEQRQWILTPKHFLNLNFINLKLHQLSLVSTFHSLKIEYSNLNIEEDQMYLICTPSNYKIIQKVCKQFLRDMLFEQEQMTIFRNQMEVNIFNKYFLKQILVDSRLQWRTGKTYLKTFHKNASEVFNQICRLYNRMRKGLVSIPITKIVKHPLVRTSSNFRQSTIQTSCLYQQTDHQIYFHIKSTSSFYNEGFGIFLTVEKTTNRQLISLLQQNNIKIDFSKTDQIVQILTEKSLNFNSIFIWKISNKRGELIKSNLIQSGILKILQLQKEIKFIFPQDSDFLLLDFFKQFYRYVILNIKILATKYITIFLPFCPLRQQQQQLMDKIHKLFRQLKITGINRYLLTEKDILKLSVWTYIELECWNQKKRKICSPLNSYIFSSQIQRNTKHKFGIFLTPNDLSYPQFLVDLYTYQIYQILQFQVNKIGRRQRYIKPVIDIAKIIKNYLCNQNYIVIYRNKDTKQFLISQFFVIQNEGLSNNSVGGQGKMGKYKIELSQEKIVSCKSIMNYKYQQIQSLNKYKLETYQQFLPQLARVIRYS